MATLKDVAKLANVDISTVSRALNNTGYVHPDTKTRILSAVKELSYQPNLLAKGLRQGKRQTIGVVIPHLHMTIFSEIVQAMEEAAAKEGYALIICTTNDDPVAEKEGLTRLRNGFVDGCIIASTGYNNRLIRDIQASGLPVVQIIRNQEPTISCVSLDYQACGYESTHFLYKKGFRSIALIHGNQTLGPYKERYNGYKQALAELDQDSIIASASGPVNTLEYGYEATVALLRHHPKIDAIMVPVDTQAIGALRALKTHGLRCPEDIALISLTGQKLAEWLETSLTTMEMPAIEIGQRALALLMTAIHSSESAQVQVINYHSRLVERESTITR